MGARRYGISLRVFNSIYLTSQCSERVRYRVEHEKRNSIFSSNHVLFCLLYKEADITHVSKRERVGIHSWLNRVSDVLAAV